MSKKQITRENYLNEVLNSFDNGDILTQEYDVITLKSNYGYVLSRYYIESGEVVYY